MTNDLHGNTLSFGDLMAGKASSPVASKHNEATQVTTETPPGWTSDERRFKVFISYSRGDSAAFAKDVVSALEGHGIAAKLDTRDLEFGEKWQAQLKDFIRQADAIVYVVSPRSIASKWCRWELAQVAAQSKRLVPVVHIAVDPEQLPAEIAEVQLFQARPGTNFNTLEEFQALTSQLAAGLQKDRIWLQEHTRLSELAYVWAAEDRSRDHLLWGRALRNAEAWIARKPPTAPAPSRAQFDFIAASQTAAKSASRRWATGATTIAVIGIALAGLAWWQRGAAIEERNRALGNESRMLAGMSERSTAAGDATEGAFLALAALPSDPAIPERPYAAEAERALYRALLAQHEQAVFDDGHLNRALYPKFDEKGETLFTLSESNELRAIDVASRKPAWLIKGSDIIVQWAAWSKNARYIVASSFGEGKDSKAVVWDTEARKEIASIEHPESTLEAVAINEDGSRIALGYSFGKAWIHDTSGREVAMLATGEGYNGGFRSATFSADGRTLATCTRNGAVELWDAQTGTRIESLVEEDVAGDSHLFFDGPRLVVALGSSILLFDTASRSRLAEYEEPEDIILSAALSPSPDVRLLMVGSQDRRARLWNLETHEGMELEGGDLGADVVSVAFTFDARSVIAATADGTVRTWDVETRKQTGVYRGHGQGRMSVTYDPFGLRFASAGDGTTRIWSTISRQEELSINAHEGFVQRLVISPDKERFMTSGRDRSGALWDVATQRFIARLKGHKDNIEAAAFIEDGSLLVTVASDGTARFWDGRTGEDKGIRVSGLENWMGMSVLNRTATRLVTRGMLTKEMKTKSALWDLQQPAKLSALSPDAGADVDVVLAEFDETGARLATVLRVRGTLADGTITEENEPIVRLWTPSSGAFEAAIETGSSPIKAIAFSPDGNTLAVVTKDADALLFDVASRKLTGRATMARNARSGFAASAKFSPDGRMLFTSSGTKSAVVRRADAHLVASFETRGAYVRSSAFSADGSRIATVSGDEFGDTLAIWSAETGQEIGNVAYAFNTLGKIHRMPDGATLAVAVAVGDEGELQFIPFYSSTEATVRDARHVPRCVPRVRLQSLGLDLDPPRWCIAGPGHLAEKDPTKWSSKWPYDRPEWRNWLDARDRGKDPAWPDGTVQPTSPPAYKDATPAQGGDDSQKRLINATGP